MLDVVVLFLEGGMASTAAAPLDVFESAGALWNALHGEAARPVFRVTTASLDGAPVACEGAARLAPQRSLAGVRRADLVVVPSTGLAFDRLLERHGRLLPWLRRWRERGAEIAGICTGVGLLAEAGLLDGRAATTHWALAERFRARYPAVRWQPDRLLTEDDGVFCGGGVYAALDLSLHLVERHAGHEVAMQCARALLVEPSRQWQSAFATPDVAPEHADPKVREAQQWLHRHYARPLRFEELAARLGMSPRNFARRFRQATGRAPLAYLHALRVEVGKRLLAREARSVAEVSAAVGYDDVAHFRALFKRHTSLSPAAWRARFGGAR